MAELKILVTGAGGFIGGAVARLACALPGAAVVGATRDGRALGPGIEPCKLDVRDPAGLARALPGNNAVVHCAGGDASSMEEGTARLLRAARAAGVRRVVHLSSIAVYRDMIGPIRESNAIVSPDGRSYAASKAAGEAACSEAGGDGLAVVILRPAIVYGPGSNTWIMRPALRLLGGVWGGLGILGGGTCNPVHVNDVAAACVAAIEAPPDVAGEAFNVSGLETLTWNAWHERLGAALGRPVPREIPAWQWRAWATAALPLRLLARVPAATAMCERATLNTLAPSEMKLFAATATYPIDKAARRLGWTPRIALDDGIAESVAWLRGMGLG